MADNESGTGGFGWFMAGLGIGALVGVLYAPKSGKETRDDLVSGAMEAKQKANEYVDQGKQMASEYAEQGKQKANELVEQGRQKANESLDRGREYYEKGRSQWTQYVEKGKTAVQEQQAKVTAAVDASTDAYQNTKLETPAV